MCVCVCDDYRCFPYSVANSISTDHTGAGVSQSPRYEVTQRGQDVAPRCDPISGHVTLYWYRQTLGQGQEFLTSFQDETQQDKSGLPSDQFSTERSEDLSPPEDPAHRAGRLGCVSLCQKLSHSVAQSRPSCSQTSSFSLLAPPRDP